jgi:DNA modification methylase
MSDRVRCVSSVNDFRPVYTTEYGRAYCADSRDFLRTLPDASVNLVITSPPFALRRKKSYGNVSAAEYVDWFLPFAEQIRRVLRRNGSFVLDIGGSWNKGEPTRSLYHFELLLRLCGQGGLFKLAQEFYWYNRAKMPAPAEWVTVRRVRVKDAVQPIWWLSKTAHPKANNRRVLTPYTNSMIALLQNGYNSGRRPSGHVVSEQWGRDNGGAIPPNVIEASNTRSTDPYIAACRKHGLEVHPARFSERVPEFFIKFLTQPGDVVLDPFAESNMVGKVSEQLHRQWIAVEIRRQYVVSSAFRFQIPSAGPGASSSTRNGRSASPRTGRKVKRARTARYRRAR